MYLKATGAEVQALRTEHTELSGDVPSPGKATQCGGEVG